LTVGCTHGYSNCATRGVKNKNLKQISAQSGQDFESTS
jgi:hypothetical protein